MYRSGRTVIIEKVPKMYDYIRYCSPLGMLTVTAEEKDDTVIFTLTGNGEPPEKDTDISDTLSGKAADSSGSAPQKAFRETGGLASLRTLVENANGTMKIKAEEAFTVIITIPKPSPHI